jgi:hypothetical protein
VLASKLPYNGLLGPVAIQYDQETAFRIFS